MAECAHQRAETHKRAPARAKGKGNGAKTARGANAATAPPSAEKLPCPEPEPAGRRRPDLRGIDVPPRRCDAREHSEENAVEGLEDRTA